ncbi:MAG TPA: YebC/PmpR family DNA-binding transcriptional regulator [Candidatus Kaiserbacteria bacterium]|nr:YebC/PmpR family DNA-binding transcriptional regulator [Candidatus Kaiserbacteria bacterium]
MSGHSKWATTKRQKASTDAAKSRVFARFSRLIALESKKTAGDISSPGLSSAISRAKSVNMPKDSIDRAVAKGMSKDADALEQIVYEFYGPSGIAIVVDALTDNRNRTTQEIKHLLSKQGYELSTPGSASWAFTKEKNGKYIPAEQTVLEPSEDDEEKLTTLLTLLDEHEDVQTIYTNARGYENTRDEDSGD